ncbi:MAG TPA: hypothetical protein DGT23_00815 [Micromonosporaceae bacterium]|nr:hypothetical protein [Micromonosporaceae bacterium]
MSLVVTIVFCVMPAVLALSLPWRYWWDIPKVTIEACSIDERPRQANGELGIAVADSKITNWSWLDREYALTLVARDHAGQVVGAMQSGYLAAIPARSSMVSRGHAITLTAPGAITCHVGEANMVIA